MERILVVANDFPYPLHHGSVIDTWGHVKTLKTLGYKVDLIATVKTIPPDEHIQAVRKWVDDLMVVERERGWRAAAAVSPFQVRSRAGLRTVPLSRQYAAVVLEAEHVAPVLENPGLCARKRILRLHNDESRFFHEMGRSARSLFHKAFYRAEALKFKMLSPAVISGCDALWFISRHEMEEHLRKCPQHAEKSVFVPPAVDCEAMRTQTLDGRTALFLGTLGFANNARAVEWYISHVHPALCDIEGYGFIAGGNTAGSSNLALRRISSLHPNISIRENPKNTESLYKEAAVFVNPLFRGAGLKLKVVDAIQAGVPIVSTSSGIQGSGLIAGKHLLVADSAQSFADCIRKVLINKDMARELATSAQEFLAREYDQARIINSSLSAIL
jgi:glycosyltransferase involved in cell wall biosynthesis